jgi:hypothetical protein
LALDAVLAGVAGVWAGVAQDGAVAGAAQDGVAQHGAVAGVAQAGAGADGVDTAGEDLALGSA